MNSRLFLLYFCYTPNTAPMNRAKAYWDELERLGIKATVVFFFPDNDYNKLSSSYKNLRIKYYWDKYYLSNKYLRYLSYYLYQKLFLKQLRRGDRVYLYGLADFLCTISRRKDISVYYETTEHPCVVPLGTRLYRPSLQKHIESCRKLTGMFVISSPLKRFFVENGVAEEKIQIINMTVDSNRFKDIEKQLDVEKYIAYCGTASNNKDGVDELIKAFALVAQKHDDVKLYIMGKTPSRDDETGNIDLINSLGIADKVVFVGIVTSEAMPKLLKNAIVLALARPDSLQAQCGFPTKLGEYLLSGNPVVLTRVGDIPLFLKDGESALIAEQRNTVEFADKLCWVLEHPDEAQIIGEKGKKVALESFNAEIETRKLLEVIFEK